MSLRRCTLAAAAALAAAVAPSGARADAPWSAPAGLPSAAAASVAPVGAITPPGHLGAATVNLNGAASPTQLDRLSDSGAPIASDGLGLADPHTARPTPRGASSTSSSTTGSSSTPS